MGLRLGVLALAALAALALPTVATQAGEFPATDRAYCDDLPEPSTYWGAGENRGDENRVLAGHEPASGTISVRNEGTDRHGLPFESNVVCDRAEDTWKLFEANVGLGADSVRLEGVEQGMTIFGPVGAQVVAEVNLGPGQDDARGHAGKDRFDGGPGKDKLKTLGGRDKIHAADGAKDKVRCGPGRDKAIVDAKDNVGGDCERVKTL